MNKNNTKTSNGALSLSTPDIKGIYDGRVSLFFKGSRGITDEVLFEFLNKSSKEDLIDTIILAFYTRDCRGGKGERDLGRKMFTWIMCNYPNYFDKVFELIHEYGRFDDLLCFFPNVIDGDDNIKIIQNKVLTYFCKKLLEDYDLMNQGKPISILPKWAPTENDSDDKKYKLVDSICTQLKISKKVYRTKYITPMRSYLDIVENLMCSNRWNEINFSKVPSCAMKRLKKAFERHTPDEFSEWKKSLLKGETTIKAKQLYPHELIKEIRTGKYDAVITEEQWKVLENEVKKLGKFEKTLCVVDTSSSMTCLDNLPLDISCALGLIISNTIEGEFKNNVITFHENPTFVKLKEGTLYDRYNQIRKIDWGGSTNIQAVFDMILEKSNNANLSEEDSPKTIIIISDMQFNMINGNNITNFEAIDKKYAYFNRKRPGLIFWNVNGSTLDFPVSIDDNGTIMLSGSSPSVLKSVFNSDSFDTISIIKQTLNNERYKPVRDLLL